MNLSEFMTALVDYFLDLYSWTTSIYPFEDFPISLFWLCESTVLTNIAWKLFPADLADNFEEFDDDTTFVV